MPFTITAEPELLRIEISGDIALAELLEIARVVDAHDEEHGRARDRLVDIRGITGRHLEFESVSSLADARRGYGYENPTRVAFIAESPISVGFARMYQSLADHPLVTYSIFATPEEGERWLAEPPSASSDSDED